MSLPTTGWLDHPIDNNELDVPLPVAVDLRYMDGQLNPAFPYVPPKGGFFLFHFMGNMTAAISHGMGNDGSTGFEVMLRRRSVFGTVLVDAFYAEVIVEQPLQQHCPDVTEVLEEICAPVTFPIDDSSRLADKAEEVCSALGITDDSFSVPSFAEQSCGSLYVEEEACARTSIASESCTPFYATDESCATLVASTESCAGLVVDEEE